MHIFYGVSAIMFAIATAANLLTLMRTMREIRWTHEARMVLFAYEKELLERGVTLPPRCTICCQVLPRHVDGCIAVEFYKKAGRGIERMTRAPIVYFPDGSQPPKLEGK